MDFELIGFVMYLSLNLICEMRLNTNRFCLRKMNSLSGQLALPSLCASGMALGGMAKWQVAKNVFISVCFCVCVWGAFKFFHFPRGALFSVPATEQSSSRATEI